MAPHREARPCPVWGGGTALSCEPVLLRPRALPWYETSAYFQALQPPTAAPMACIPPSGHPPSLAGQVGRVAEAGGERPRSPGSGRPSSQAPLSFPTHAARLIGTPGTELPGGREAG